MDHSKVDEIFVAYEKMIKDDKKLIFRNALKEADDSKYNMVNSVDLLSPTRTLLISIFLGGLGIDRFFVGDIGLGFAKLFFNWLTLGIWGVIDIFVCYQRAKDKNFLKLMLALS